MELQDDRTKEEKGTHTILVAMTDRFMSGWGKAEGGTSYAAWAVIPRHAARVERWVKNRSDSMRVRIVDTNWRPRGKGHAHIYVVNEGHPALAK